MHQAGSGTASVNVSNWPTVSLPKSTGIKAPIDTNTKIVPKKIVGEPAYGAIRKGAKIGGGWPNADGRSCRHGAFSLFGRPGVRLTAASILSCVSAPARLLARRRKSHSGTCPNVDYSMPRTASFL